MFSIEERERDLFDAAERLDLEGIVAKLKVDPYSSETVWYETVWYKIKEPDLHSGRGTVGAVPEAASLTCMLDSCGTSS